MSGKKYGYQEQALEEMGFYEDMRWIENTEKELREQLKFSDIPELNDVLEEDSDDGYVWTEDEREDEYPDNGDGNEIVKKLLLVKDVMPSNKRARRLTSIAKALIQDLNLCVLDNQEILEYDTRTGAYLKVRDPLQCICAALPEVDAGNLSIKDYKEIAEYIRISPRAKQLEVDQLNSNEQFVNCGNGVINLEGQNLIPHSPRFNFTYSVKANYLYNTEICCPDFENFCQTSLEGDSQKRMLLLEAIGYICCDSTGGKCSLFFKGAADSGKSVLLTFIERLFQSEAIANIPLHKIADRFSTAELCGKKLNCAGEIKGKKLADITVFKSITGGDRISGERKGQDLFYFRARCKLVFSGNALPGTTETDATAAFVNRLVVLLFNKSIPKDQQDKNLGEKLWNERDAIFTLAIRALCDLRKRNFVFTKPSDSKVYLEAFAMKMNSVQSFVADCCQLGSDLRVFNADLLTAYSTYCRTNGLEEYSKTRFYELLDGIPGVYAARFRMENQNRHGRKGIALKREGL